MALLAGLPWVGCGGEPEETGPTGGVAGSAGEGGEGGTGGGGAATGGTGGKGTGGTGGAPEACDVDGTPGECVDVDACTDGGVAIPGYCPGAWEIKCCVYDEVTCDEEVHVLPNGGLWEVTGTDGCPVGMLRVDAFCIDRFEATLETLDGKPWSPYFNPGDAGVRALSVEGAVPQGYVSGDQAAAACANAGKRLCTDEEWLRACQGPGQTTYPYGDEKMAGMCNDARAVHPAVEYFGTAEDWIWSELGNACISQLPGSVDRTGENPGCITAEGAYDMMGNVHEWTADPDGTFRGGFYVDTVINGPGCLYKTTAHDTGHSDYSTGFRCCADAP